MVEHQEKLWTFDAVEAGQIGNETTVEMTPFTSRATATWLPCRPW